MKNKIISSFFILLVLVAANACKEDEPPLPDNLIQFATSEQGISDNEGEATIKLTLSRAAETASTVVIDLTAENATYGTEFTTQPAAENNSISLTIPVGSTEASIKIIKKENIFLTGDESLKLTLTSVTTPVLIGSTKTIDIQFAAIVSDGSELTLNGIIGTEVGTAARNSIYVDFSNNETTPIDRASWDFGFYTGDLFRVILNNTTSASAKVLDKTDLKAVVAADTVPSSDWTVGTFNPSELALVDGVSGDVTKTVMAEVSATDADNKVYIVNRGVGGAIPARPWLKIRTIRKGNGYTLQYARITDTEFKSIDIEKDDSYNFVYVSVDGNSAKKVAVEPQKANWDIKWGYHMSQTPLSPGVMIPYASSDFVTINHIAGVEAAEVLTSAVSYDAFAESNIAAAEFKSTVDVIGTNWRTASSKAGESGVKNDRFYVIKDLAGNVYKLRFLRFHPDEGGTRGKPELEYKLVKKGA